jgi:mono/diheme cytochrome c family protein
MRRILIVGTIAALAAVLPACSNSSSSAATGDNDAATAASAEPSAAATVAAANGGAANGASANDGAGVYATNCSSCHQSNGAGLPGAFPPLANNPVVNGDPKALIHIVKFGLNGKIMVGTQAYNGTMPAWGQNLSDGQVASAVTFIRASWGNHASAVSAADVAAAK